MQPASAYDRMQPAYDRMLAAYYDRMQGGVRSYADASCMQAA